MALREKQKPRIKGLLQEAVAAVAEGPLGTACGLDVKPEMHHITILDDVFLAFQTPFTGFFGTGFTLELDEIVIGHDFGTDKAFSKSVWITPAA